MMKRVLLSFALALSFGLPAAAGELTQEQRVALGARIAGFVTAIREQDFEAQAAATPPQVILRYGRERTGGEIDLDAARALFAEDTRSVTVQIERQTGPVPPDFTMIIDEAEFLQTPDGTPYVLIPSEFSGRSGSGQSLRIRSPILALMDGGEWYFFDVGYGGLTGGAEGVYPAFDGVEFPRMEMEVVPE